MLTGKVRKSYRNLEAGAFGTALRYDSAWLHKNYAAPYGSGYYISYALKYVKVLLWYPL
jgi:hypothetical protein